MRISDWSSDVSSSDLPGDQATEQPARRSRNEGRRMMFESLIRHPMRLLIGAVVLIVLLSQTLAIVPEDKQALILRFGEIERTVNRYKPGEDFGRSGAGLVDRKSKRLNSSH